MNTSKFLYRLIGVVLLAVLLLSCSLSGATPTGTKSPPTLTPIPTRIFTPTITSTSTSTHIPTATFIPSATPTLTPLPTLSAEAAKEYVGELFRTNLGCLLPCWWGITPGQTLWSDAKRFLEQFALLNKLVVQTKPQFHMDILLPVPADISPIWLEQIYGVKNEVVETIEIQMGYVSEYTLSAFLGIYGPPGEVWLSTYSTEYPPGVLPFLVVLFYPDKGILALYGPEQDAIIGGTVQGCKMDNPPTKFGLWSPDVAMTFMEAAEEFRVKTNDPGVLFLPLEEATGMDVQTFYETYLQPDSPTCLKTPKNLWPEQY